MSHEHKEGIERSNVRLFAPGISLSKFTSSHTHTHCTLVRSDRRNQCAWEPPLEIADKFALAARLGTLRESAALLDGLPLFRDEAERSRAVLDGARLDEPAADDEARAANAATAVDGGNAPTARVVPEHGENLPHVGLGAREGSVGDREGMVLDVAKLDADARHVRREVWRVRREFSALRQVDERPHACAQQ